MTPARLAYFAECVRRHANVVPSLAAEVLEHVQEQAEWRRRAEGLLACVVGQSLEFTTWDELDWPAAKSAIAGIASEAEALVPALKPTP